MTSIESISIEADVNPMIKETPKRFPFDSLTQKTPIRFAFETDEETSKRFPFDSFTSKTPIKFSFGSLPPFAYNNQLDKTQKSSTLFTSNPSNTMSFTFAEPVPILLDKNDHFATKSTNINSVPQDSMEYDPHFIGFAIQKGYTDIALQMLRHKNFDPSKCYADTLYPAVQFGRIEILKLLLNDTRVDPSNENNRALKIALYDIHFTYDKTTGITTPKNVPFVRQLEFSNSNHVYRRKNSEHREQVVKMLISDANVDKSIDYNEILKYGSKYGWTDIVKLAMTKPNVDPSLENNYAMIVAAYNGHVNIVKLLLMDNRVKLVQKKKSLFSWLIVIRQIFVMCTRDLIQMMLLSRIRRRN